MTVTVVDEADITFESRHFDRYGESGREAWAMRLTITLSSEDARDEIYAALLAWVTRTFNVSDAEQLHGRAH